MPLLKRFSIDQFMISLLFLDSASARDARMDKRRLSFPPSVSIWSVSNITPTGGLRFLNSSIMLRQSTIFLAKREIDFVIM